MEIKAEVKSISKLKDYFFLVPDYQREYIWKPNDQVEQFIIDMDNEFEPNVGSQKSYFIGSIIIVENKGKFDVIDGQQRLTTIILSLCAFRDLLKPLELDSKQKKYLQTIEELLSDFDINTDETKLRLELQYNESKDYLSKLIQSQTYEEEMTPSINKMAQAYTKLKLHFESYLKQGLDHLTDFARYFLTKIELVIIESEDLSSALKIFETVNQRGAGLNAMDLVKNLLFSEAKASEFQNIKDTWKNITTNLQACNEESSPLRFLRYFLMARYHDGVIREDDIYKWIISSEGKKATQYKTKPLGFAKELHKISKRYSELVIATELVKDGGIYPNITNIGFVNKYKSRQHLILLLALDVNCTKDEIEYLAEQIESFFFFSNTIGIQAKNNERLFAIWASKLRGLKSIDGIKKVVASTMMPYIGEKISPFKSEFLNIRHGAYNPLYRLRYVLGKIENTVLVKSGLPIKGHNFFDELEIEHILPQTPKGEVLPSDFTDKDEYDGFVYKLGNVTLLESTINQAINNCNDMSANWYQEKQNEYTKSDVVTTNLIDHNYSIGKNTAMNKFKADYKYSFESWNKETILKRQRILMEFAFETWKFNGKRIDKQILQEADEQ
ncbi:conserved hypothetical protein [Tenacibaculum maritimum]|uniref:DUF262 domain-containing protein n=1 Tax=Tenacibaculum maritimum TaxID=107401 RepID=UPI0012E68F1D|nr:DUF262 domain-containing protein [Tenacibaculum maritimum]CAA0168134.1 conserved hypothetical protein [Tenacibaculum maritimum]